MDPQASLYDRRNMVATLLRDRLGRDGTTAKDAGIDVIATVRDKIRLHRRSIGLEINTGSRIPGGNGIMREIPTGNDTRTRSAVDGFVDRYQALVAREDAITRWRKDAGASNEDHIPDWSLLVHPLTRTILKRVKISNDRVTLPKRQGAGFVTNDHGFMIDAIAGQMVDIDGERHSLRLRQAGVNAGELRIDMVIAAQEIVIEHGGGQARLTLPGSIPQTLMTAARGRSLDNMLSHPLLVGSESTVTSIAAKNGNLIIRLRGDLAPLADAPEGVETGWRKALARG